MPPCVANQALADCALVIVSMVVKVLLATKNRVLLALSFAKVAAISCPSTLLTKCMRLPVVAKASNASTAICGPRSEPPIPMLTMSVMAPSARTLSAKASMASSVPCTWANACASWVLAVAASTGARKSVCHTSRCSVVLITSPANMASRCANRPDSRAN